MCCGCVCRRHPSTTGLRSIDYYISSDLFHLDQSPPHSHTESAFLEQLVRLPASLGTAFERPALPPTVPAQDSDLVHRPPAFLAAVEAALGSAKPANLTYSPFAAPASLATLVEHKRNGDVLILIPQHLPKFHPSFDVVMKELLDSVPNAFVVITYDVKKSLWRKTLETRWSREAGFSADMVRRRVLWLEALTPQQYLAMLALGDVMVDPFPFGGGVTTLEALAVCTPVVTLPALQNVPALTAGMLRTLSSSSSSSSSSPSSADSADSDPHLRNIFSSVDAFIQGARVYLTDPAASEEARRAICRDADSVFASPSSSSSSSRGREVAVAEWAEFLATASSPSPSAEEEGDEEGAGDTEEVME
jgi:protein O-GlcNAc transferase